MDEETGEGEDRYLSTCIFNFSQIVRNVRISIQLIVNEVILRSGGTLTENVHYDPLPVKDLVDPSMSNWCHHTPYILKQGRTVWWDPREKEVDELFRRIIFISTI